MANEGPLFWSLIAISWLSWPVLFAVVFWKRGSPSTPRTKQPHSPPPTPASEGALAQVMADQAELFSALGKITTTVKRLSSRQGMQDVRARGAAADSNSAPPEGTSKADLLRHYGMLGKSGPEFARAQLALELDPNKRTN